RQVTAGQLPRVLQDPRFGYRVDFEPPASGSSVVRRIDKEHKALTLSAGLTEQPLKFQLATSLGLLVLDREKLLELQLAPSGVLLQLVGEQLLVRVRGAAPLKHALGAWLGRVNVSNDVDG